MYSVISHPYFDGLLWLSRQCCMSASTSTRRPNHLWITARWKRVNTTSVQPLNWERNTHVQLGEFITKVINPPKIQTNIYGSNKKDSAKIICLHGTGERISNQSWVPGDYTHGWAAKSSYEVLSHITRLAYMETVV